jgi:putative glycosyltransferase (TIGR04372 family)
MFESLYVTLLVGRRRQRPVLLAVPEINIDRARFTAGVLLPELLDLDFGEQVEVCSHRGLPSKVLTMLVNVLRFLRNFTPVGRGLQSLGLQDVLLPRWLGVSLIIADDDSITAELGLDDASEWPQMFHSPLGVRLSPPQQQRGIELARDIGLEADSKFVCLYVRDQRFETTRSVHRPNCENADIASFQETIRRFVEAGYTVVRVGDPTMVPYQWGEGFVDYVHHPAYSRDLDLYLYANCSLWFGTMGGARSAPFLFERPSVTVNSPHPERNAMCLRDSDVLMLKHVYSLADRRYLSLSEQLDVLPDLAFQSVDADRFVIVDNQPDELAAAAADWLTAVDNPEFDWLPDLQRSWHDARISRTLECFGEPADGGMLAETEMRLYLRPRLAPSFLSRCWEPGAYLDSLPGPARLQEGGATQPVTPS